MLSDPEHPDPWSPPTQDSSLLPCSLPTWGVHGSFSPSHPQLSPIGDLQSSVTFDLTLDPGRLNPRAIFEETKTWNLTRVRVLGLRQHCEDVRFLLPVRKPWCSGDGGISKAGCRLSEGKEWGVFWSSLWLSPSMALGIQEELNIC